MKVFRDAIQERKGSLHNSHLHSNYNKAWIKMIMLSVLLCLIVSCGQCHAFQTETISALKANSDSLLLGDKCISNKDFAHQVNTTCVAGQEACILNQLTIDYYKLLSHKPKFNLKLDKLHTLSLKTYKEKSGVEEHIRTFAILYAGKQLSDSLLCYEYYNNANTLSCYEQFYYIDVEQRCVWTIVLTYDEESAKADNVKVYRIDLARNRFHKNE